jgi:hypothetical protein
LDGGACTTGLADVRVAVPVATTHGETAEATARA